MNGMGGAKQLSIFHKKIRRTPFLSDKVSFGRQLRGLVHERQTGFRPNILGFHGQYGELRIDGFRLLHYSFAYRSRILGIAPPNENDACGDY